MNRFQLYFLITSYSFIGGCSFSVQQDINLAEVNLIGQTDDILYKAVLSKIKLNERSNLSIEIMDTFFEEFETTFDSNGVNNGKNFILSSKVFFREKGEIKIEKNIYLTQYSIKASKSIADYEIKNEIKNNLLSKASNQLIRLFNLSFKSSE